MFSGVHPDALSALSGGLVAGGLFILYGPPLDNWSKFKDPDLKRLLAYSSVEPESSNFLQYLQKIFFNSKVWSRLSVHKHHLTVQSATPELAERLTTHKASNSEPPDNLIRSAHKQTMPNFGPQSPFKDQLSCIHSVLNHQYAYKSAPAGTAKPNTIHPAVSVISAGRGRGKSAALGIIAANYINKFQAGSQLPEVMVTAPSRDRVSNLFKHAQSEWIKLSAVETSSGAIKSDSKMVKESLNILRDQVQFIAPNDLLENLKAGKSKSSTLLIIDEAASLPLPLLSGLLSVAVRCVLAATTSGYEGCGQGFRLRFLPALVSQVPNFQHLHLQYPIRWKPQDPLELFMNQAFLLANDPKYGSMEDTFSNEVSLPENTHGALHLKEYSAEQLLKYPSLLSHLFQLLTMAHYRTTPDDLRSLLDCPDIRVFAVTSGRGLVACLLLSEETPFIEEELKEQVWSGHRRPKGHLIQQSLTQQLTIREALDFPVSRIIRIAVHPKLQGKGIGSWMLQQLPQHFLPDTALQGTSFSSEPRVNNFWQKQGYELVRLGTKRGAYSGSHSVLMIKAITKQGSAILRRSRQRFLKRFLYDSQQFPDKYAEWPVQVIHQNSMSKNGYLFSIDSNDLEELELFAKGQRPFSVIVDTSYRAALRISDFMGNACWQACIVQQLSLSSAAKSLQLTGKKEVVEYLRMATREWLACYGTRQPAAGPTNA